MSTPETGEMRPTPIYGQTAMPVSIHPIPGMPEIAPGADLGEIIVEAADRLDRV